MDSSAGKDIAEFVNQVMDINPGCDGLLLIPYLLGERAPVYNPNVRGVFFGVSINHTNKHFQRALLEGEFVSRFDGSLRDPCVRGSF